MSQGNEEFDHTKGKILKNVEGCVGSTKDKSWRMRKSQS